MTTDFLNGPERFQEICKLLAIAIVRAENRKANKHYKKQNPNSKTRKNKRRMKCKK